MQTEKKPSLVQSLACEPLQLSSKNTVSKLVLVFLQTLDDVINDFLLRSQRANNMMGPVGRRSYKPCHFEPVRFTPVNMRVRIDDYHLCTLTPDNFGDRKHVLYSQIFIFPDDYSRFLYHAQLTSFQTPFQRHVRTTIRNYHHNRHS